MGDNEDAYKRGYTIGFTKAYKDATEQVLEVLEQVSRLSKCDYCYKRTVAILRDALLASNAED